MLHGVCCVLYVVWCMLYDVPRGLCVARVTSFLLHGMYCMLYVLWCLLHDVDRGF